MQIVKQEKGKMMVLDAKERQIFSETQGSILKSISSGEKYPKEIARELKLHEQKVYYHIRELEKKGIIHVVRKEERGGALAKLYKLSSQSFFTRFGNFSEARRVPKISGYMSDFISSGKLNAKIVVGSPEPHGPERARSRDVTFAVDLALFLGTFLNTADSVVLEDKDARRDDLDSNLIVIGGPITNRITKMVNDKLPVKFDKKKNIVSKKKVYKQDDCGFIVKTDNPLGKGKIVVLAGKRYSGTKAAVLAFVNEHDNLKNHHIVQGFDNDGDGDIDSVKFLE